MTRNLSECKPCGHECKLRGQRMKINIEQRKSCGKEVRGNVLNYILTRQRILIDFFTRI